MSTSNATPPPKTNSIDALPVGGAIFAIIKPLGSDCMSLLTSLKPLLLRSRLFMTDDQIKEVIQSGKKGGRRRGGVNLKIGQGGTLDPKAEGVLVVGVGNGTRKLTDFLECDKEYEATVLLGSSTTTYDSEGSILDQAPWEHVNEDTIRNALPKFTGEILQMPPVYSALKMDGKPLYAYAREGKPLPRPIEARKVTIRSVELLEFKEEHEYKSPDTALTQDEKENLYKTLHSQPSPIESLPVIQSESKEPSDGPLPVFTLRVRCSGGTYIRSLAHDLCQTMGSAGHLVKLVRTRQGDWSLEDCVDWPEIIGGSEAKLSLKTEDIGNSMASWEEAIMKHWEVVDVRPPKKNQEGRRERMTSGPSVSVSAKRERDSPVGEEPESKKLREGPEE